MWLKILDKLDPEIIAQLSLNYGLENVNSIIFCYNCIKLLKQSTLPSIHASNGLCLEAVPKNLGLLSDTEQQLIAKSLIFMKLKRLPTSRIRAVFDRVVTVPLENYNITKTTSKLPRKFRK